MKIDDYYRQQDMREQELTTQSAVRQERIEVNAERIEADDELIEAAISAAITQDGDEKSRKRAAEFDDAWKREIGNLFRARTNANTDAMLEAAQGIADLTEQAVNDLAEKQADEQQEDAA
ncbi:MAG: hypothetical protein ACLFVU_02105 [Phycisphaerae bacterium]